MQGGYINAYQIKQYRMVQSSFQPSHHIATDENRKIPNRGLDCKLIFNCIHYVEDK